MGLVYYDHSLIFLQEIPYFLLKNANISVFYKS